MKKKFLFVSKESLSGDLSYRLSQEGHEVKIFMADPKDQDVFSGFLKKVASWGRYLDWADIIIFEDENFGKYADKLRKKGKLVIGGSEYTDRLEIDRDFGQEELAKYGVPVLPNKKFESYSQAIKFLNKNPGRYVFKASGDNHTNEKNLVYIAEHKEGKDLLEFLIQNQSQLKKKAPHFLLQKFVDGIEVAVGAFFNGHDFIYPINVNFEHKRLFPNNLGPMTGEMGTLMYWSKSNNLFKQTLAKFLKPLRKSKYIGYIDLNCIVNKDGIYPLEFTSRFGYPTIQIQLAGIDCPAGVWLEKLASGRKFTLPTLDGFQIGVVIATPPLLSEGRDNNVTKLYNSLSIFFAKEQISEHIHLGDVKRDSNNTWRVAGVSGWNLVVTGVGPTVYAARQKAYHEVDNIKIPNMFYRDDIGERWRRDKRQLVNWGYINE